MALNVSGQPLEFDVIVHTEQLNRSVAQIQRELGGLTNSAEREAAAIQRVASSAGAALAAFATFSVASNFLSDVVAVRGEFQKLAAVLSNSLGSESAAQESLRMISDYVAKTPFELGEVSAAYVKLVNQGLQPTVEQLTKMGDLAASTGKGFDQLAEAILDAQTGEFERLKEFGVRASKSGDQIAFTFKGVTQQVAFSSKAIQDYIIGLGNIQGVSGATAKISETLTGKISNLRDAWTQMLNNVGQGGEGIFSTAIEGATELVNNYETVIKILEEIVLIYGSYRAAIIANVAITKVWALATGELTIAQRLQAIAAAISQRTMALLNATMLSNPFVAVTSAILVLVGTMKIFGGEANAFKTKAELMAAAQERVGSSLAETEAKIRPYVERLKDANISENERLSIYNKLKAIDPQIVQGIDAKSLSYQALTKNVESYLGALRKQIAIETNKTALTESIKQEQQIEKAGKNLVTRYNALKKEIADGADDPGTKAAFSGILKEISANTAALREQQQVSSELGKEDQKLTTTVQTDKQNQIRRTIQVIDAEIKAAKDAQAANSTNAAEYQKSQQKINALEEERRRIVGASKSEIKAAQVAENKTNELLDQRKELLRDIEDLKRGATQSGLSSEASAVDRVNAKYDQLILKISDFNKKAGKQGGQKVGQADIVALNAARAQELDNVALKQDAERYTKSLEQKRDIFERYEQQKRQIGEDAANAMYAEQTKGFETYADYIRSEMAKVAPKFALGIANVGEIEKFKSLFKELAGAQAASIKQQQDDFAALLQSTTTFSAKRKQIEDTYTRQYKTLEANRTKLSAEEYRNREAILKSSRDEELRGLQLSLTKQSALYRKLGEDTINFTKEQAAARVKELQATLQKGTFFNAEGLEQTIPPELMRQLAEYIRQLQKAYDLSSDLKTAELFTTVGNGLSSIASDLGAINTELGQTIGALSQLANAAGKIGQDLAVLNDKTATSAQQVSAGLGIVGQAVSLITTVVQTIKASSDSKKAAAQEMKDFQAQLIAGEVSYNEMLRERARLQIGSNKLTIEAIEAQKRLLQEQQKSIQAEADSILKRLQGEQFIAGQKEVKKGGSGLLGAVGGIFGFGKKTVVENELASLAGKTFEEIERLYNKGSLTDNAKKLFEQLQKIKAEGADVEAMLEENKRRAAEIFTGTTAKSLADTITEGLRKGYKSVQDFADNMENAFREAILSGFEAKVIEEKMKDFYDQFAAAAQSNGGLDKQEIEALRRLYENNLQNILQQFEQLQNVTGQTFNATSGGSNSLQGAIKGITEQTAELLAGQFGGMRIAMLDQLAVARVQLQAQLNIENNTALTVTRLEQMTEKMSNWFTVTGIKIR